MNNCVIYTDGSFRPNVDTDQTVGSYGSGAHGYVFDTETIKSKNNDTPTNYYVTTEGYIINTEYHPEEYDTVVPCYYIDASYSFLNNGTVGMAELYAILFVLRDIIKNNEQLQICSILIKADSMYAIDTVNKIKANPKVAYELPEKTPNAKVWIELTEVIDKLYELSIELNIKKVQAHSIHVGNNIADSLAYYARVQSHNRNVEHNFHILEMKKGVKYWESAIEENELLKFRQLYFTNSLRAEYDEVLYCVMNYKTGTEPGVRTHDAVIGLVSTHNPPAIIEDAIKVYHRSVLTMSVISTVDIKNLYSRDVSYYYKLYGDKIFSYIFKERAVYKHQIPVVKAMSSPAIANRLLGDIKRLYDYIPVYTKHKDKIVGDAMKYNNTTMFIDVTNKIYKSEEVKKRTGVVTKTTCTIPSGSTFIDIECDMFGKHIRFPLSLGKDTLDRNQFKRLETSNPVVILIAKFVTNEFIEYLTLIEVNNDIGVYCNPYSNRIVLKEDK